MSDELIFDSERQMRRDQRRRRLIPLLALAAILIVVAVVLLLLRGCRGETHTGGESTEYTYTWAAKANGDTELTVSHEDLPAGRWALKDGEESLPALRVTREAKEYKAGTVFTLHPEAEGRCLFTLVLQSEEGADPSYELVVLAQVTEADGKLSAAPLNASGTRFQAEIIGGGRNEGESGYRIRSDKKGDLVLSFPVEENETDWEFELTQEQDSLKVLGLLYEDGDLNAYLRAGTVPGTGELVLSSVNTAATIRLRLECGADGSLKVLSHEAEYGEKPAVEPDTEPVTTESGGDAVVATTGGIPIFSDDHHLEMSEDPNAAPAQPSEDSLPSEETSAPAEESTQP